MSAPRDIGAIVRALAPFAVADDTLFAGYVDRGHVNLPWSEEVRLELLALGGNESLDGHDRRHVSAYVNGLRLYAVEPPDAA